MKRNKILGIPPKQTLCDLTSGSCSPAILQMLYISTQYLGTVSCEIGVLLHKFMGCSTPDSFHFSDVFPEVRLFMMESTIFSRPQYRVDEGLHVHPGLCFPINCVFPNKRTTQGQMGKRAKYPVTELEQQVQGYDVYRLCQANSVMGCR